MDSKKQIVPILLSVIAIALIANTWFHRDPPISSLETGNIGSGHSLASGDEEMSSPDLRGQRAQASTGEKPTNNSPGGTAAISDLFPLTGDRQLLEGLLIKELPKDLSFEDATKACMSIKRMERDLVRRILNEEYWLADVSMTYEEAVYRSERGGLVLNGKHPKDPMQDVYFECPASAAAELMELQNAFQLLTSGRRYEESVRTMLLERAKSANPGDIYRVIKNPEGAGLSVINGAGEIVVSQTNSVPGMTF